jgi:hypothetical protein
LKRKKKRTAAKSKAQYESVWFDALAFVQQEKERGNDNLSDILQNYHLKVKHRLFENKLFYDVNRRIGLRPRRKQVSKERFAVQSGAYATIAIDMTLSTQFIDILSQFIADPGNQINCVVELGSGIGRNIFTLAQRLEERLRERIMFHACEPTSSGSRVCEELHELDNTLQISTEYFDYYQPDLSFLRKDDNVLFFTAHSIEQIPTLNRSVLEEMISVSNRCFCFHAEPVGWQYVDELRRQRAQVQAKDWKKKQPWLKRKLHKADRFVFSKFGLGFMDTTHRFGIDIAKADIGRSDKVSANAAKYSSVRDYNTNLVPLLKDMEGEGLLIIDTEKVNLYGEDPFNPTTVIAWHKV